MNLERQSTDEHEVITTTGSSEAARASSETLEDNLASPAEIHKQSDHLEIRRHTQTYAPLARSELAGRIKMARLRKELGLISSEEENEVIEELQDNFNKRFGEEKDTFESEVLKERSVAEVSKNKHVLFVHTMPFDKIDSQANTSMNNQLISTEEMTTEDRIGMILHEQPSISCSTVSLDSEKQYGPGFKSKTMYPFGVVLDEGIILSAHRNDGGIETVSRTAKHRKYDTKNKDSSVQPNIIAQVEHSIEGKFSREYDKQFKAEYGGVDEGYSGTSHKDYNELVIAEPHISGFFIDADETYKLEEQSQYREPQMKIDKYDFTGFRWKRMKGFISKYPDVPIYIREHGVTSEYIFKDGEIKPAREEGKIDVYKPAKGLGDYEFSHAAHLKIENKVEERNEYNMENGFHMLRMTNLGKIIEDIALPIHYTATSWKYSRRDGQFFTEITKDKDVDQNAVFEAIAEDYKSALNEIDNTIVSIKEKVTKDGPENIYGRDGFIKRAPEYRDTIRLGFAGFIDGISSTYPELAERLKALG